MPTREGFRLDRNFLHAAKLEFTHPSTGRLLQLEAPLPDELNAFLVRLENEPAVTAPAVAVKARAQLIK